MGLPNPHHGDGITVGEHTAINLGPDPPDALQELSAQRRVVQKFFNGILMGCYSDFSGKLPSGERLHSNGKSPCY